MIFKDDLPQTKDFIGLKDHHQEILYHKHVDFMGFELGQSDGTLRCKGGLEATNLAAKDQQKDSN